MSTFATPNNERTVLLQKLHGQIHSISKLKEAQAMQPAGAGESSDRITLRHAATALVSRLCGDAGTQPLDMNPFWDFFLAVSKMEQTVEALTAENKRLSLLNRRLAKAAC